MFFLKGTRKARIKTYQHHDRQCSECSDFDLTVKVYKSYFHFWFIPIVATGIKTSAIKCNSCGAPIRSDSLSKEYESKTRIPFYLYTGVILVGLFIMSLFVVSAWGQHERTQFVSNPQVGDVYLIKGKEFSLTTYYFVRVQRINGDSVIVCNSHLGYLETTLTMSPEDYFVADQETLYRKGQLKELFEKGAISTVVRDYDEATGFRRIR